VSVIDFVDDTAELPGVLTEYPLDRERLELVVVRCGLPWALM